MSSVHCDKLRSDQSCFDSLWKVYILEIDAILKCFNCYFSMISTRQRPLLLQHCQSPTSSYIVKLFQMYCWLHQDLSVCFFFSVWISSSTETCLDTNLSSYAISGSYSGTICNVLSHHKCLCLRWHLITRQVSVKAAPALLHENGKIPLSLLIPPLCGAYTLPCVSKLLHHSILWWSFSSAHWLIFTLWHLTSIQLPTLPEAQTSLYFTHLLATH